MLAAQVEIGWLLALLVVTVLGGIQLRRYRRIEQARVLHLAESRRVLRWYARIRDGRCYDPQRYPETIYQPESMRERLR